MNFEVSNQTDELLFLFLSLFPFAAYGLAPNKSDNLIYDFKSNKIFS